MQVSGLSWDTFWKGETEIRGTAADGEETYRVRILYKGSRVFDYSCSRMGKNGQPAGFCSVSCTPGENGIAMCPHGQAVLEAYLKSRESGGLRPVSTSQRVRFMIREYTNRAVGRITGAGEEGRVRLVPRLFFGRERIRVRFFVGIQKLYEVKDLVTFSQAVEFERTVDYGKGLSFYHSLQSFLPECRPMVLFVMEASGIYREHFKELRRSALETEPNMKELTLGKAGIERFFGLTIGQTLECEDYKKRARLLTVREGRPSLEILVRREGRDGVRVSVDKNLMAFMGEHRLFLAGETDICRCDEEYTEALSVFMENMVMGPDSDHEVLVNDRDMPLFYERVLKRLEVLKLIRADGVDLDSYRPEELKAGFYFDSAGPGEISMTPELSYGDFSFHPMEDENVPRDVCRDVPGEFRVSQVITKYFRYAEDGTGKLLIRDDDEAVWRLLSEGMAAFQELGNVYVSEEFKKVRLLPPANVSVRATAAEGWLELEVDAGGLSREELSEVLKEYGKKKKFYRMKNGDFLTLGDGGLLTIAKLAKSLDLEKALEKDGPLRIPRYRAVILDALLKEDKSIACYRDQLFKAIVRGMKDVEDSDFEVPAGLSGTLREYQKVGFRWMRTLDFYGFGGILADEMGLGKTIQVIALLLDEKERVKKHALSLIVCPSSLVYNWENEISVFAPSLKAVVMAGTQAEREQLFSGLAESGADVLITSFELLKRDILLYKELSFRFQIVDEAQYIKNASTQAAKAVKLVDARTRFALTGTPMENHLGELWSIFDFLMPGFLFTASAFKKRFETPIVRDGDEEALNQLRRMTGPFLLRRLKKDVLKELPDKLETVLYSAMEGEQKRLYAANAARLKERLAAEDGKGFSEERMEILAELMRLRQICCEPSLCYSGYRSGSAKLKTCMELLENGTAAGHKILLFSQFTSMLEIIAKQLKKEKIPYYMLTGATPKRERMQLAASFQKDDVKVFLISLKAGGTGLNLAAADIVIHYDPWWNAAAQNQATDRAHRIGQEKQVTVFKLITKHTVEENILKLQEQKKHLADTVVTEGMVSLGTLTREDILAMLEE